MKVSLVRSYRSKNGNVTFVYGVKGNPSELQSFRDAQGDYYREDDNNNPLWFTTRCIGDTGKLIITSTGNIVPDMSEYDKASSLVSQYGGNFGEALSKAMIEKMLGKSTTSNNPVPKQQDVPSDGDSHNMGDL